MFLLTNTLRMGRMRALAAPRGLPSVTVCLVANTEFSHRARPCQARLHRGGAGSGSCYHRPAIRNNGQNNKGLAAMIVIRTGLGAVLAAALLALAMPAQAAKVYKWVDAAGITHYGEKAPEGVKSSVAISVSDTTSSDAEDELKRLEDKRASQTAEKKKQAEQAGTETPKDEQERRQKACEQHRKNLATLNSGARVATRDEKGNQRYLNEEELAAQRKNTEAEVRHCDDLKIGKPAAAAPAAP